MGDFFLHAGAFARQQGEKESHRRGKSVVIKWGGTMGASFLNISPP
jgi:hypothetical protein